VQQPLCAAVGMGKAAETASTTKTSKGSKAGAEKDAQDGPKKYRSKPRGGRGRGRGKKENGLLGESPDDDRNRTLSDSPKKQLKKQMSIEM